MGTRVKPSALVVLAVFLGPTVYASLQCRTLNDFKIVNKDVTDVCCDDKTESCPNGIPSACDAGCAALLVPAFEACAAEGGFLQQPYAGMANVRKIFAAAAANCPRLSLQLFQKKSAPRPARVSSLHPNVS